MGKKKKAGNKEMERPRDNKTIAVDLLPILQREFDKAKANKDHAVSSKLRKQIWVVTDFSHGVVPDMPEDELREVVKDLPLTMPGEEPVDAGRLKASQSSNSSLNRLNKLKSRLEQIAALKDRQAKGELLEKNQIEKIASEDDVRQQFMELEQMIAVCS